MGTPKIDRGRPGLAPLWGALASPPRRLVRPPGWGRCWHPRWRPSALRRPYGLAATLPPRRDSKCGLPFTSPCGFKTFERCARPKPRRLVVTSCSHQQHVYMRCVRARAPRSPNEARPWLQYLHTVPDGGAISSTTNLFTSALIAPLAPAPTPARDSSKKAPDCTLTVRSRLPTSPPRTWTVSAGPCVSHLPFAKPHSAIQPGAKPSRELLLDCHCDG
jgi:hypothetical protein